MANDQLKRYLVERLLQLDPTLSDAPNSKMFDIVIDPLIERLGVDPLSTDIESFVFQRLKDDPQTKGMDFESAGSYLKDTIVRPLMVLLEPLQREIELLKKQQSFNNLNELSKEEFDALLANIFFTRAYGSFSRGKVKVHYSTPQPVAVDAAVVFSTINGLQFIPEISEVRTERDFTREGDSYYVEFELRSSVAHIGANIGKDTIKLVSGLPNVVRVTNPQAFSGGINEDDNARSYLKAQRALSERSTNTKRGIETNLFSNFPDLVSVEVVGYKDPEMQRDVLKGTVTATLEDTAGEVVYVTANVASVHLGIALAAKTASVLDWNNSNDNFPFTNIVALTFPGEPACTAAYASIQDAAFMRIGDNTGLYNPALFNRLRTVVSITPKIAATGVDSTVGVADELWVTFDDFEVVNSGKTPALYPNDNLVNNQGATFYLRNSSDIWRGAPLPHTNRIYVDPADAPTDVIPGRDFLVIRGYSVDTTWAEYTLLTYPVLSSGLDGATPYYVVGRSDYAMMSKRKIVIPTDYVYSTPTAMISEWPEVIAYGAPGPAGSVVVGTVFNGVDTVVDGATYHGGVALYHADNDELNHVYVVLAAHASRPNGWLDYGVTVGQYISLACVDNDGLTADKFNTAADVFQWMDWGRIVEVGVGTPANYHIIRVEGIQITAAGKPLSDFHADIDYNNAVGANIPAELAALVGPNFFWGFHTGTIGSPFRLHWTVYTGELESYLPNGKIATSYADLTFMPAARWGRVALRNSMDAYVHRSLPDPATPVVSTLFETYQVGYSTSFFDGTNTARANFAVVRFNKDLADELVTSTAYLLENNLSATLTRASSTFVAGRYPDIVDPNLGLNYVVTPVSLPVSMTTYGWTDVGDAAVEYNTPGGANSRGLSGYELPDNVNNTAGDNFALVHNAAVQSQAGAVLTISDVPGSYPFTDKYGLPLTVNSDEVHIGGIIDVYAKAGSVDAASVIFNFTSQDVRPGDTGDVISEVTDGASAGGSMNITSAVLFAPFTALEAEALVNCVVEIIDNPTHSADNGMVTRILDVDKTTSTLRCADVVNNGGANAGATFRVYRSISTGLDNVKKVVLSGDDLAAVFESRYVTSTAGFVDIMSLGSQLFLEILSGSSMGEYTIVSVAAGQLTLASAVPGSETNLEFRVYIKYSGLDRPVVRVKSIELSADDGAGIEIPYKFAVDVVGESFSAMNNDPITITGGLVLRTAAEALTDATYAHAEIIAQAAANPYAQVFPANPGTDFVADYKITVYDVVKILGVDEADTYWWVRDILTSDNADPNSVLILDRDVSATFVGLTGTIGKAAVGDVQVYFLAPTLLDVGPDTVMKNSTETLSFRPSPAEEAEIFQSSYASLSTTSVAAGATIGTVVSDSVDFERSGARAGDRVEFLTKVLMSSADISAAVYNDASILLNKTLVINVDNKSRSALFTSTGGTFTLTDVANQINTQLGIYLRAEVVMFAGPLYRLALYSSSELEIRDSSTGVLSTLQFNALDNNVYNALQAFGYVDTINYASGTSTINLIDGGNLDVALVTPVNYVFIKVVREEHQIIYPATMVQDGSGLYYATFTAISRAPLSSERLAEGEQLSITGYDSLGYYFDVENSNYTYSDAEQTNLVCTPIVLPPTAVDMSEAYVVPTAEVSVQYDRSQLVQDIQAHLLTDYNRVVVSNPLARHFLPGYPYLNMVVSGINDTEAAKNDLVGFIQTLYPNRPIESTDLENVMVQAGADYVVHPVDIIVVTHDENRNIAVNRSENRLVINRRFHLMESTDTISVTKA